MKLPLFRDYYITSSVGDRSYTLKTIKKITKKITDKKSEMYGQEQEIEIEDVICYPDTIESGLQRACDRELLNSRVTTWDGYLKEVKTLQKVIKALAEEIGADNMVKKIMYQTEEFLSQGDDPEDPPKKRGRKKKEDVL